jgi:hypothetical protein
LNKPTFIEAPARAGLQGKTMTAVSQKLPWIFLAVFITLILGLLDWLSGYDLNFFVFYFFPIFIAAWFLGAIGAVIFALFCSVVWFAADVLTGHTQASAIHAVWNTMIRLIAFFSIGWSISSLKQIVDHEKESAEKLRKSLSEIKLLQAFLPICAQCKKIRDEQGVWQQLESYISEHGNTQFSHSYCPECCKQALAEADLLEVRGNK